MRAWLTGVIAFVLVLAVGRATADPNTASIRVIVNAKSSVAKLERRQVSDLFLKKRSRLGNANAAPVDLGPKSEVRARFSRQILQRDLASVRSYWAQLVFSGRGVPPPELASERDVVEYVASHAGAIGYVSGSASLVGVKAVEVD